HPTNTTPLLLTPFPYTAPPPPQTYTLSLHDALPISKADTTRSLDQLEHVTEIGPFLQSALELSPNTTITAGIRYDWVKFAVQDRSEEHTSELQSRFDLVCRLLLEKKKNKINTDATCR